MLDLWDGSIVAGGNGILIRIFVNFDSEDPNN